MTSETERLRKQTATHSNSNDADSPSVPPQVVGWKRVLYLTLAGIFFVLGILGAVFPLLPATPFLLLTSYFLLRTSPQLNRRLLRSKFFGPILSDWQKRGGVRRDVKVQAIVIVCLAVAMSIYISNASTLVTAITLVAATIGIGVIIRLPSL